MKVLSVDRPLSFSLAKSLTERKHACTYLRSECLYIPTWQVLTNAWRKLRSSESEAREALGDQVAGLDMGNLMWKGRTQSTYKGGSEPFCTQQSVGEGGSANAKHGHVQSMDLVVREYYSASTPKKPSGEGGTADVKRGHLQRLGPMGSAMETDKEDSTFRRVFDSRRLPNPAVFSRVRQKPDGSQGRQGSFSDAEDETVVGVCQARASDGVDSRL